MDALLRPAPSEEPPVTGPDLTPWELQFIEALARADAARDYAAARKSQAEREAG